MGECEPEQAASGEREHPCLHHVDGDAPFHGALALGGAHAHDGRGVRVRRGNRQAGERGQHKAEERGSTGREPLERLQLHHVEADALDDALASHGRADAHVQSAEEHEPDRQDHLVGLAHACGQGDGQHEDAHELLAVLGAVHERHARTRGHLGPAEHLRRALAVHVAADAADDLGVGPAQEEPQQRGQQDAVHHLHPLAAVDGAEAALQRDGRAREAGDERVRLARGDAEPPGGRAPHDDGDHGSRERDERLLGVAAEIHHVEDGVRDGGRDERDEQQAQEVADRRHEDGELRLHGPRRYDRGDGVRGVGGAVDDDDADIEQRHGHQHRVGGEFGNERSPLYGHRFPLDKTAKRPAAHQFNANLTKS